MRDQTLVTGAPDLADQFPVAYRRLREAADRNPWEASAYAAEAAYCR